MNFVAAGRVRPDWRARAACLGADPAAFHERAWNDDKQRPGPELHVALEYCRGCAVRQECAAENWKESLGVWFGTTPPERRGELPLKEAVRKMRGDDAIRTATSNDFSPAREPVPGAPTAEEIDEAYKMAWQTQAEAYGGYLYVPRDVARRLGAEHAAAHRARYGDYDTALREEPEPGPTCALDGCDREPTTGAFCSMVHRVAYRSGRSASDVAAAAVVGARRRAPATGLRTGTACRNGHDLRGEMPNGKPVLHMPESGRPVCRLCKLEAAQRHAERKVR